MTRASVHNAVLLTTEPLENVLSHLPKKDLLLAQRVSHKWHAVISESKQLQQALFFVPHEADAYWELIPKSGAMLVPISKEEYEKKQASGDVMKSGQLNELLFQCHLLFGWAAIHDFRFSPSARHVNAWWRRKFVTQPPPQKFSTNWEDEKEEKASLHNCYPGDATADKACERILAAESRGEPVKISRWFIVTAGIFFPSEAEAPRDFVVKACDEGEPYESGGDEN